MTRKTDSQLHRDVLEELRWDTRVDETHVGVQVEDGVVTLCGTVKTYAEKVAAVEAAHRVDAVSCVADELKVHRMEELTDSDIAAAVRHALEWDVSVPADRIHTTVSSGVVTLRGDVDTRSQREDAARAIRNLRGVRAVIDEITLKPAAVSEQTVRIAVEQALERRIERETRRLNVAVSGSAITVSGIVHSWAERQAVLGAARGTHGVETVIDELQIVP